MLCASDTEHTVLATCPITITNDTNVNCSSSGGVDLNSSSINVNKVITCPNDICLPLLPIDYSDSKV